MIDKIQSEIKIGIIGAGIVGLSTACILQERYPSMQIRIHAAETLQNTTSWGAAGFCKMKYGDFQDNNQSDIRKWFRNGMAHYMSLYRSNEAVNAGIQVVKIYDLFQEEPFIPDDEFQQLHFGFRSVHIDELKSIGLSGRDNRMKYGFSLSSPMVESRYYLPYLTNRFTSRGGYIKHEKVTILSESSYDWSNQLGDWANKNGYDAVFNCAGLGSRWLVNDDKCAANRGQVIRVSAPWFKIGFMNSEDTYAYPGRDSVILGGFRQQDDYTKSLRADESRDILDRIAEYSPCLATSPIMEEWCGLRPTRSAIRVEREMIQTSSSNKIPLIHNYGHSARGIALSWGSSLEAVDLIGALIDKKIN